MFALCPALTSGTSISSIRVRTCIRERSLMLIITVPGLFIVPVITTSPCLALRREITPSIGEVITVRLRSSLARLSAASTSVSSCFRISRTAEALLNAVW